MKNNTMMQKTCSFILRTSLIFFLLFSGIVFYRGILDFRAPGAWQNALSPVTDPLLMCITMLFFILLFLAGWFVLQRLDGGKRSDAITLVFSVVIVGQLLILFFARPVLRHDALKVFDEALSMLKLGGVTGSHFDSYFMRYTNNNAIVLFTYGILKIAKMTGLLALDNSGGMLIVQLVNLIAIDASLYLGLLFLHRLFGDTFVKSYLLLVLFCPIHYVWVGFYYTNTIAMPFFMLMLYFVSLCLRGSEWSFSRMVIIGFCAVVGFLLRATNGIVLLAVILYLIFKKKNPKRTKHFLSSLALGILIVLLTLISYQKVEEKYILYDTTDSAFPPVHWIMMGMGGEGDFNQRDEMYTRSFVSQEEKKAADQALLTERVKALGTGGVVNHCISKLVLTFSDGTGNYPAELSMSDGYKVVYQLIYGSKRESLMYVCQAIYLVILLFAIVGGIRLFLTDPICEIYIPMISITGAYIFHMLWEAGSIYSIGFFPLLYLSSAFGFEKFAAFVYDKAYDTKHKGRISKYFYTFFLPLFCLSGAVVLFLSSNLFRSADDNRFSMNQFMFVFDQYQSCEEGKPLTQTFHTDKDFDTIEVMVHNPFFDANDSRYLVQLTDANGKEFFRENLLAKDCADLTYRRFAMNSVEGVSDYCLVIKKVAGEHSLSFPYYGTGNYDIYKGGKLLGVSEEWNADLTMKVYKAGGKQE